MILFLAGGERLLGGEPDARRMRIAGLVPSLLGLIAGIELRGRISPKAFRRVVIVLLIVSVANLLRRAIAE